MNWLVVIIGSYLLGSVPFSYIIPKFKAKKILAMLGDAAKGFLAVSLASYYFPNPWLAVAAGLAAIVGNDFSIFLKFKGGKGAATTGGALLAFDPVFALILFLLWALLFIISRYYVLSTLIILGSLPLMLWVLGKGNEFMVFGILAALLAISTHREEIKQILSAKA